MRLLSTLKSKQNQAPIKYKMWTSQFVHILGAWSYPYSQTNQTSTYSEHLLFILTINPSATKLSDVFE